MLKNIYIYVFYYVRIFRIKKKFILIYLRVLENVIVMCLFNIIFFCFYFFRVLCLFGRVFGENGDVFVFGDYYIEVWIEVFVYLLYIFVLWSCWYGICVLFLLFLCYWVNLREFGIVLLYFLLDIDEYWL